MDERFNLHAPALRDRPDFLKRQFTRQDHTREAELFERQDTFQIVCDELGGRMQRESREMVTDQARDTQVLHDDAVGAQRVEKGELFDGRVPFTVVDKRVERDVDFFDRVWISAGLGQQGAQFLNGGVDGVRACGKGVHPDVNGIRAGGKRGAGGFNGTGGG